MMIGLCNVKLIIFHYYYDNRRIIIIGELQESKTDFILALNRFMILNIIKFSQSLNIFVRQ